jgi:Clp amino terminal domain, pathogenicity island component
MFERYTEKARRTIFFARYEASAFGSPFIETEHILLGLLREDKALLGRLLPDVNYESIHREVTIHTKVRESIPTHMDLPLASECRRALKFAAEEAERLDHRHIGTDHLLLGLLREDHFASQLLREHHADLAKLRLEISQLPAPWSAKNVAVPATGVRHTTAGTVEIHGKRWNSEYVREIVNTFRKFNWHWNRCAWKESDVVTRISDGSISRDLSLAADSANFRLVLGGWKKDDCLICGWELFCSENDPEHGIGCTNGRNWLCTECYEKFFARDFFASANPEIT